MMMDVKKLFELVLNGNIDLTDVENWVKSEEVNFQRPDIKTGLDQFSENDLDHLIDQYSDWEIRVDEFIRTVSHYSELANELIDSDPDRSILIAKVRKILSKLTPNPINLANANFQLGYLLFQVERYHDAIQPLREAASLYSESGEDPLGEVTALSYLSDALRQDKQFVFTLNAAEELLEKATKYGFRGHIALALRDKGQALVNVGRLKEALICLKHAVDIRKSISDEEANEQNVAASIDYFLDALGQVAARLKHFEVAISTFRELAEFQKNAGNKFLQARAISDIGYTYVAKGDFGKAIQHLEEAISLTGNVSSESLDDANRWQYLVQNLKKKLLTKNLEEIILVEADSLINAECSYCGRKLQFPNPLTKQVKCICGYIHLFEQEIISIPLIQSLQGNTSTDEIRDLLQDTDDPDKIQTSLEAVLRLQLDQIRNLIVDNPKIAAAAVWKCLVSFDSRSRKARSEGKSLSISEISVFRATQILIAYLFELGELPRSRIGVSDDEIQHFVLTFSPVASDAAMIAPLLDNLRRGLMYAEFRDGVLYDQKTYLHTQLKEWEINRNIRLRQSINQLSADEIISAASVEAQSIYLGFSPYLIAADLFKDKHLKLSQLAVDKEASVYCIPVDACPDEIRNLFSYLTLKPERIANFKNPFYFDLGEEEETPSELYDFPLKLAQKNWMNYYPIVPAIDHAGESVFLVSAEALTYTNANLETFKNRLLESIYSAVTQHILVDEEALKRLGDLRNEANRRFENFATDIARASGWYAKTSIRRVEKDVLPGGEIDVLMVNHANGELKVVLAEVKDFDMTLYRIYSESRLGKHIRHAEDQLDKKSKDVRLCLPQLVTEVSKGEIDFSQMKYTSLIKIIITSDYLPPFLFTRYPGVALVELSKFLEGICKGSEGFPPRFISSAWEDLTKS